jgi:hypothetical protein
VRICIQLAVALVLATPLSWCASRGANRECQLAERAEVSRATILLSELLPPGASAELQKAAKDVAFGRSPLPGSSRVLGRAEIVRTLSRRGAQFEDIAVPGQITVHRASWPIRREALRTALVDFLEGRGWQLSETPPAESLQWTGGVANPRETAGLQVDNVDWDAVRQALQFRVHCADRGQCGSFLVWAIPEPAAVDGWRDRLRPAQSVRQNQRPVLTAAQAVGQGPVLAGRGERAILLLEHDQIHISMPVICLEQGVRRQQIRVRDPQSRRIFRAEVVDTGRLRAEF